MPEFILLLFFLLVLAGFCYLNYRQFKHKKRLRFVLFLPITLTLLLFNTVLVSLLLDQGTYERLTKEHTVAVISFEGIDGQLYRATIKPAHSEPMTVELHGDQWQMDARILKWTGPASYLGFQPVYILERISGRYHRVQDEFDKPRSVIKLTKDSSISYWNTLIEFQDYIPWLDAYYGNAVYLPMRDGAKFMITLGHQGLIARPRNYTAAQSIKNWTTL